MTYSILPKCKQGVCIICQDGVIKDCVKVGKDLICIPHRNSQKSKQYFEKSKLRSLVNYQPVTEEKTELDIWFDERHEEMTGSCANCNCPTKPEDPKYWKYSVAHILSKALFPSIATHPLNFVELCYFESSCHSCFDNNGYEYANKNRLSKKYFEI